MFPAPASMSSSSELTEPTTMAMTFPAMAHAAVPNGMQWPSNAAMMAGFPAMLMMQQMQAQMAAAQGSTSSSSQPPHQPATMPFGMQPMLPNSMLPVFLTAKNQLCPFS
jgi:hypothetical protein